MKLSFRIPPGLRALAFARLALFPLAFLPGQPATGLDYSASSSISVSASASASSSSSSSSFSSLSSSSSSLQRSDKQFNAGGNWELRSPQCHKDLP